MRRYETIFILRPDLGEPAQKEAIKRFEGFVASSGGDLIDTEEWGFRELAYRIKGEQRGFYIRLDYGGSGATMNEVERNLKLSDSVLRYLSVLSDEFRLVSFREIKSSLRMQSLNVNFTGQNSHCASHAAIPSPRDDPDRSPNPCMPLRRNRNWQWLCGRIVRAQ